MLHGLFNEVQGKPSLGIGKDEIRLSVFPHADIGNGIFPIDDDAAQLQGLGPGFQTDHRSGGRDASDHENPYRLPVSGPASHGQPSQPGQPGQSIQHYLIPRFFLTT